jgi:SAM-dependent methyltransferase
MALEAAEVAAIRESQYDDIAALRRRMAVAVEREQPSTVLSVGEGCDRVASFTGGCLAVGALPGSTRLVVPFDVRAVAGSFHRAGPPSVGSCRIAPLLGDVLAPPLTARVFDMVASSMMIDDVADPSAAVASMMGLVAPGGCLVISGHGIDARPEWDGEHGLLASNHRDQVYSEQVERWIHTAGGHVTHRWRRDHTWLLEAVPNRR